MVDNGLDSAQIPTSLSNDQIRFLAERGVDLCRKGEWKRGFEVLSAVAKTSHREGDLPGVFHSYLGYGIARYRGEHDIARALAKHAAERRFFEPENFLNLARIEFLAGDRLSAYQNCIEGLRLDPRHAQLRKLLERLGRRRRPALAFLPRSHPINRFIGQFTRPGSAGQK